MRRKIAVFLMFVLVLAMLSACGSKNSQNDKAKSESVATGDVEYPIKLVDQAGREVVIDKKPERLVSSYYITTSALIALGLGDRIVGVESNPEKRDIYGMCAPYILNKTQVGSPKEFDVEACALLHPDLVILPMRAKVFIAPLEKLGITVIVVNPESQEEIFEMLLLLGKAADCNDRANELVDYIKDKVNALNDKMKDVERPTVYLGGNSSFFSTASKGMYQNNQIQLAGGINVAGDIDDTYWVESSYEQILEWNPQVIMLASDAKYSLEEIKSDSNLKVCQALIDDKVFKIPSDIEAFDSPVPSSFLGAVYMASVLHPEVVSQKEYEDMVEEFYEKFYGFSIEKK